MFVLETLATNFLRDSGFFKSGKSESESEDSTFAITAFVTAETLGDEKSSFRETIVEEKVCSGAESESSMTIGDLLNLLNSDDFVRLYKLVIDSKMDRLFDFPPC